MKCPKCNDETTVICHGKRYSIYPSGCLALFGPVLAIVHQASTPVDYECKGCGHTFGRRSAAAKVGLVGILLIALYMIWITYQDLSGMP